MAQLVEHHLAKVRVAGSNPVVRSKTSFGVWRGGAAGRRPFTVQHVACASGTKEFRASRRERSLQLAANRQFFAKSYDGAADVGTTSGAAYGLRPTLSTDPSTVMVPLWYHSQMDVNIKGLEPEELARLSEQASAEGLSQQEWIRRVLRCTAGRLSAAELATQRASVSPMGMDEFENITAELSRRRTNNMERLGAGKRRR